MSGVLMLSLSFCRLGLRDLHPGAGTLPPMRKRRTPRARSGRVRDGLRRRARWAVRRDRYYLFENWKRLRAPFCPYFLRSLTLGSRVRKPACLSGLR